MKCVILSPSGFLFLRRASIVTFNQRLFKQLVLLLSTFSVFLADLFAIIKTTEKLEKAYIRDLVPSDSYESECLKLIAQFKMLSASIASSVPSIERFAEAYKLDCPHALNRLIISGVPVTVEHRAASTAAASSAAATSASAIAQCVQNFITAMDTIKLNMIAVDQVT